MIDLRFHRTLGPYTIATLAEATGCILLLPFDGTKNADILINHVKSLTAAGAGDICFLENRRYYSQFTNTKASACIVPHDFDTEHINNLSIILLKHKNPYFAYTKILDMFYTEAKTYTESIASSAYTASTAQIGKNCYIGHNVVIEDNVVIGDNCIIESGAIIEFGTQIGHRTKIGQNVVISHSIVGNDCLIKTGAKIGQTGFGFSTENGTHHRIYHTGKVVIGNQVMIGANTTIDRGSLNDTVIEDLCQIDNLVQIGHNVKIGRGSILVAQVGIAGSSKIGQYCALGGQVGVSGHINIGDFVQVAARGGVIQNVEPRSVIAGLPAVPIRDWHKQTIIMKQLIKKSNKNDH